jgi:hypothetical protein
MLPTPRCTKPETGNVILNLSPALPDKATFIGVPKFMP